MSREEQTRHPESRVFREERTKRIEGRALTKELVLRAVEQVPPGSVVSYGDIAELVGTSARRVGSIMASHGGEVSWWRVTNRNGELPARLLPLARKQWDREGIGHDERRCSIATHRADLVQVSGDYEAAVSNLVED